MSYDASLLYSKVKVTHITPIPVSKWTGRPLICVCLYHHDYTILSFINTVIDIVITGWKMKLYQNERNS